MQFYFIFVTWLLRLVSSQSFKYEQMNGVGVGRRIRDNYNYRRSGSVSGQFANKFEYPESLPSPSSSPYSYPFHNIYQGTRRKGDKRVYNNRFDHVPTLTGHQVSCDAVFECIITHLSVETEGGIPIIIRGGAGYRYFLIIAKAKAGEKLSGRVRAYCKAQEEQPKL